MLPTLQFIDRDIALENMVLIRDLLGKRGIVPFLHYGTLLGAMRERDFIPYDDDADMGLYGRDKDAFLKTFPDLEAAGFSIVYIRDDGYTKTKHSEDASSNFRMYKFKRKEQELDIFLAYEKKAIFGKGWDIDGRVTIPHRFLATLDTVEFLGHSFAAPHDPIGFLRNLYGETWNVPIKNTTSRIGWATRLKKVTSPARAVYYARRYVGSLLRKSRIRKEYLKDKDE